MMMNRSSKHDYSCLDFYEYIISNYHCQKNNLFFQAKDGDLQEKSGDNDYGTSN